jgi:phosphate transport system protein
MPRLRETFELALQHIQDDLLALGNMVEEAIMESVQSLVRRDREVARRLMAQDRVLNEKRFAIEQEALILIATQQPMATDMRTIAAVLAIVGELERIGDYAKGIAKINLMMEEKPFAKPLADIPLMAEKVHDMLHRALGAFVERDADVARSIPDEDDYVDALYNQVYRELITIIVSNPLAIDQSTYLMWVAHNLERAADRVINICERVVFTVTGEMMEMDVGDHESTYGA